MKRIELKKVSIVFLTMLLFLSIQIPAFAADMVAAIGDMSGT